MDINCRDVRAQDVKFVYATMLRALRHGNDFFASIDQQAFYANYATVVERLLATAQVRVACLPDDTDVIVGYCISSPGVLHFCFTKSAFRGLGVQRALLNSSDFSSVTHLTRCVNFRKLNKQITFNPFLLP